MRSIFGSAIALMATYASAFDKKGKNNRDPVILQSNGAFKIVQFTDLHMGEDHHATQMTLDFIAGVIHRETPQFVAVTGDLVSGQFHSNRELFWETLYFHLANVFEHNQQPWAWVPGPHDFEAPNGSYHLFENVAKKRMYDMTQYNHWKWHEAGLHHPFTFDLKVHNTYDNSAIMRLFFFGTGRYDCMGMGGNDCIRRDAIEWFRSGSESLDEDDKFRGNGIAFMHYALHEHMHMANSQPVHGQKRDYSGCQAINTGLFAEMVEQQTIRAVFAGGDHSTDLWAEYNDIMLGYGRKTGFGSYGPKFAMRGARVIQAQIDMESGEMDIETWIRQEDYSIDRQEEMSEPTTFSWLKKGHCLGSEDVPSTIAGLVNINVNESQWTPLNN